MLSFSACIVASAHNGALRDRLCRRVSSIVSQHDWRASWVCVRGLRLLHAPKLMRLALAGLAFLALCTAQAQPSSYVIVHLPKGVSIELPRNWVVISNNQRTTLDAAVVARQGNAGMADFRSDLAFAANYYDDSRRTAGIVNVRYYPEQTVTQADARNLSAAEVRELDALLQQDIQKGVALSGNRLLAWQGTSKNSLNGLIVFISSYRRSSPNGIFQVRLVRVLDAGRSFTLTISYREDQAYFLQPISDYVIRSLRKR